MTCHERVELMQRYLDHDLSETEEQELLLHLQQCDECTGLFARLKRLDQELAQLPKVTPAFSLVDAILPQLAQLDRLPAAFEETAAREPVPAAAATGGIPRTRRSFSSWKLAGGTAVAAAVIGLFIMKEQNLMSPSFGANHSASTAAGAAKVADNAKSWTAAAGGASASSSGASSNAPNKSDAGSMGKPERDAPASAPDAAAPAAKAPQSAAGTPVTQTQRQTPAADTNRVAISSTEDSAAEGAANRNTVPPASSSSAEPGAAAGTNASQPAAGVAAPPAPTTEPAPSAAAPQAKGVAPPNTSPPAPRPYASLVAPPPEAAAAPAPATMPSPDGKLIAAFENSKVVVRQAETAATVRTSTYSWQAADIITFVSFTADGKLSYRVQHPSEADIVVLDVATGTETKTKSAPAAN